jgi:inner membrane protein
MNRANLILKAFAVGLLTVLLLIPLGMINGTIAERAGYRRQAIDTVAQSYAGAQSIAGPVLVVPYEDARDVVVQEFGKDVTRVERTQHRWVFFPGQLNVTGVMKPDVRQLGLHKVRVYELQATVNADFAATIPAAPEDPAVRRTIRTPYLSVSLADVRGLAGTPKLTVGGKPVALRQGVGDHREDAGLHADLAPVEAGATLDIDVALDLALSGTESLAVVPIGDSNAIRLSSDWEHPHYGGSFLPRTKDKEALPGFGADWNITALAAASQRQYRSGTALGELERLEVDMVDPVNVYSQADRATKYGVLFVVLTFAGFFMFELIKRLPIHPIQYGLVGLALAIFFLLLVSLSEHIDFWKAYLVASAACIGLLGFYLSAVLKSAARGTGFAGMLTLLYGALYGLLVSEDNALVLGSLLLFAILAAIMVLTRKVDWYALGRTELPPVPASAAA